MKTRHLEMELRTSPHTVTGVGVEVIMRNVVYSLLPIVAMSYYVFGLSALVMVLVATLSALLTEYIGQRMTGKENTLGDYSAVITGILLGLTLPPGMPLWMAVVGGVISISLGKLLFGGLGFNVFNPALVGRAFLQAAFPVTITTWSDPFAPERFTQFIPSSLATPFMKAATDGISGATPLAAWKFDSQITSSLDLFMGTVSGSAGETGALLILVCGLYLTARKMLDWRIPAGVLISVALLSGILYLINPDYPSPFFMLFSGGLMLGAFFMATDMVTSPVTPKGVWLFSGIIGVLTVVIRVWGGLPEGIMYAILLANGLTPLLNRVTQPRVYGKIASSIFSSKKGEKP